ncbi:MAG: porin family protein [Paludibacter sp.]|nr:porin family protein [Paludibacter sp.]
MKENKNRDMKDAFSEQIKQKLANHTMPVDAAMWKSIQHKIAPRKRIVPWWVYVSVSAAAGIALVFTLGNFFLQNESPVDMAGIIRENKEVVAQKQSTEITNTTEKVLLAEIRNPQVSKAGVVAVIQPVPVINEEVKQADPLVALAAPQNEVSVTTTPSPETEKEVQATTEENKPSAINSLKEKAEELEADWTDMIRKKEDRKVLLAAGLGSGIGSSSVSLPGRSRAYRHQSLVDLNTNYNNVLTPSDFNKKDYMPPVTVGVSARLPLDKRFSLESGLLYTYLTTKLSGNTTAEYTAESNLHYLGVPLNLITSLFKENHWEIYVSTGGTVEKGLRSDFRQYQDYGSTLFATVANTSIDGLQWSVNASLGVAYHLNQNISLYLDPKLSYYFENDQPFSIRSDMPLLVALNTGLRMSL